MSRPTIWEKNISWTLDTQKGYPIKRCIRVAPRCRRRGSRLAGHVEVDVPVAELVAIGHVCGQAGDFEVGIVGCSSNARKSKK